MKHLKELRIDHDKTQQDIADILRISRAAYGQYETGKREMTYETMATLANYYGVTLDYLLDHSDFQKFPADITPADHQLLQKYKALDGRGRRTVRAVIDWESRLLESTQKEKD